MSAQGYDLLNDYTKAVLIAAAAVAPTLDHGLYLSVSADSDVVLHRPDGHWVGIRVRSPWGEREVGSLARLTTGRTRLTVWGRGDHYSVAHPGRGRPVLRHEDRGAGRGRVVNLSEIGNGMLFPPSWYGSPPDVPEPDEPDLWPWEDERDLLAERGAYDRDDECPVCGAPLDGPCWPSCPARVKA